MPGYQRISSNHHLLRRLWLLGFVLSLLMSQSLGQVHAVKHGFSHGEAAVTSYVFTAHAGHDHHDHHDHEGHEQHREQASAGFLDLLFSSHSTDADCRLYDQLADSNAVPMFWATPLPIVLPSIAVASFVGDALARWAALFDARGPPLTV